MKGLLVLAVSLLVVSLVRGHGRLIYPPSRSSMWRCGFNTPENNNDNQLFCGGAQAQRNNCGKCGVCGDNYNGPYPNEAGGMFATGTIGATYKPGERIEVAVDITAHHKGWFEFKLCPNNDPNKRATQDCFDQYLLPQPDGATRYMLPNEGAKVYGIELMLPQITCSQCILQWRYHTGNSWGCDGNCDNPTCLEGCKSDCELGKGHQEEFWGCSDIEITTNGAPDKGPAVQTRTCQDTSQGQSNQNGQNNNNWGNQNNQNNQGSQTPATNSVQNTCTCDQSNSGGQSSSSGGQSSSSDGQNSQSGGSDSKCVSLAPYNTVAMTNWCKTNCKIGHCPSSHCNDECRKLGKRNKILRTLGELLGIAKKEEMCRSYKSSSGGVFADGLCQFRCMLEGETCPNKHCVCSPDLPSVEQCYHKTPGDPVADKFCSVKCSYGNDTCPEQCICMKHVLF